MFTQHLWTTLVLAIRASSVAAYLEAPPTIAAADTVSDCSAWHIASAADSCESIAQDWYISTNVFKSYNPSVGTSCKLVVTNSYCTERNYGIPLRDLTTNPTSSTTPTTMNGIITPQPIREDMVSNCNKFFFVIKEDSCDNIAATLSITVDQLYAWNPSLGSSCGGLWPNTYICVGLTASPSPIIVPSSTIQTSLTKAALTNGINTPTPVQTGMIGTCDEFYLVKETDTCFYIAQTYRISLDQFYAWNPAVGSSCATLWPKHYVCVSLIGVSTLSTVTKPTSTQPWVMPLPCTFNLSKGEYICPSATPTPITTKPGNGLATPRPFQAGMTNNCKEFHKVVKGDECFAIANTYKIDIQNFYRWNPAVGTSCRALWLDNYVCVGV